MFFCILTCKTAAHRNDATAQNPPSVIQQKELISIFKRFNEGTIGSFSTTGLKEEVREDQLFLFDQAQYEYRIYWYSFAMLEMSMLNLVALIMRSILIRVKII